MIVDPIIWQNAITPGVYIHIVTGEKAKDILPKDVAYAPKPNQHVVDRLHKAGFHRIKGLTAVQAEFLLNLAITQYLRGGPEPWRFQALINSGLGKHMSVKERYVWMRETSRKRIIELLGY